MKLQLPPAAAAICGLQFSTKCNINVSIERLGAQAKIRKKPLHSHDIAREADSIEIDLYLCIELYKNVKISVLVAISLLQIELSLLKNDLPGYLT